MYPYSTGGGRVSEILIRPLISLFYPELCCILQPLSGEYAARRSTLAPLPDLYQSWSILGEAINPLAKNTRAVSSIKVVFI